MPLHFIRGKFNGRIYRVVRGQQVISRIPRRRKFRRTPRRRTVNRRFGEASRYASTVLSNREQTADYARCAVGARRPGGKRFATLRGFIISDYIKFHPLELKNRLSASADGQRSRKNQRAAA